MKAVVYNLGCKVNQYECDGILRKLAEKGFDTASELVPADLYVINTCAVTNEAERKSRQCVTRCRRLNPRAKIVVCGCASQRNGAAFAKKEGVTLVCGTARKGALADMLEEKGLLIAPPTAVYEDDLRALPQRTRAFVKIQDGCDNYCAYCLIPYVRGRSRSREPRAVVAECESLAERCKEIVLTGIDLSSYGKELGGSLTELLRALAGLDCRVRLGSLEANVIDEAFLNACAGLKSFCPQFHLSLQSGSDAVLKRMNRKYTTAEYARKAALIRSRFPDAALTTDLICGFPTETDAQFEETLEFLRLIGFAQTHVFGYSARAGTVAARYPLLPSHTIKERCERAQAQAEESRRTYLERFIGKPLSVLIEETEDGLSVGYSAEYLRVGVRDANAEAGAIVACIGKEIDGGRLIAAAERS